MPVDLNKLFAELNCSLRAADRSIETGGVQAGNSLFGLGKTPLMRYTEFSFEIPRANRAGIDEREKDPQEVNTLMQANAVETETDRPERL